MQRSTKGLQVQTVDESTKRDLFISPASPCLLQGPSTKDTALEEETDVRCWVLVGRMDLALCYEDREELPATMHFLWQIVYKATQFNKAHCAASRLL